MFPAFIFLIISILIGKRFAMYALPIYWFGVAYLFISLSYVLISYIKLFKTKENQVKIFMSSCICIGLIILISNISISSCKNYGRLSNKKLDELKVGSRVEVSKLKKNPLDFVLWKPSNEKDPGWDSPWGRGRPGWHL